LPTGTRDEVAQLQEEVARMTRIIRRFLDSTRGLKPDPERVEVRALLAESLHLSLSADARTRIQVQTELEPGLESAVIDPGLVRHVLTNFISNAVDAMAESWCSGCATPARASPRPTASTSSSPSSPPSPRAREPAWGWPSVARSPWRSR